MPPPPPEPANLPWLSPVPPGAGVSLAALVRLLHHPPADWAGVVPVQEEGHRGEIHNRGDITLAAISGGS